MKIIYFATLISCFWNNEWCYVFAAEYEEHLTAAKYYIIRRGTQLHRVPATQVTINAPQ